MASSEKLHEKAEGRGKSRRGKEGNGEGRKGGSQLVPFQSVLRFMLFLIFLMVERKGRAAIGEKIHGQ